MSSKGLSGSGDAKRRAAAAGESPAGASSMPRCGGVHTYFRAKGGSRNFGRIGLHVYMLLQGTLVQRGVNRAIR